MLAKGALGRVAALAPKVLDAASGLPPGIAPRGAVDRVMVAVAALRAFALALLASFLAPALLPTCLGIARGIPTLSCVLLFPLFLILPRHCLLAWDLLFAGGFQNQGLRVALLLRLVDQRVNQLGYPPVTPVWV